MEELKDFKGSVGKGVLIVPLSAIAGYFGKVPTTVTNWKGQKGLPVYDMKDKKNRFDFIPTVEWKRLNVKEKFSPNRTDIEIKNKDEEEFKVDLPFGMQIGNIDLDNSQHLGVLAIHPYGEMIRDTLKTREEIKQKRIKTAEMKKELISVNDVDKSMSEQAIIHKQDIVNSEKSFPTTFANKSKEFINTEYRKFNDKRLKDLDKIINKTFPNMKASMYDLITLATKLYKNGVNMDKMVEKLKELDDEN